MSRARPIFVVEDCDEDFETVRDAARRGGVPNEIRRAASGAECLRMLGEAAQDRHALPALLLMDLNTPNDDGREALRTIKRDPLLCAIPLVVLSTSDNPRDVTFCYANRANAYHVKPVIHAKHLRIVDQIFGYWLTSAVLSN